MGIQAAHSNLDFTTLSAMGKRTSLIHAKKPSIQVSYAHLSSSIDRLKIYTAVKRKRIANIFSVQNVVAFEPRVRAHIERFCAQLDMRCKQALGGISGFNWVAKDGRAVINSPPREPLAVVCYWDIDIFLRQSSPT
jgi:hypothetical protein